jgi:hypothetical protein
VSACLSAVYVCMYICVSVCMYACLYVFIYGCVYVCMHLWRDVCLYVCMYVYLCLQAEYVGRTDTNIKCIFPAPLVCLRFVGDVLQVSSCHGCRGSSHRCRAGGSIYG